MGSSRRRDIYDSFERIYNKARRRVMTKTNFRRIGFAVLIMIVLLLPIQLWAQDAFGSYKVGEKVEYRDRNDKTDWFEGTIVRLNPRDELAIIRWDPRADYPS